MNTMYLPVFSFGQQLSASLASELGCSSATTSTVTVRNQTVQIDLIDALSDETNAEVVAERADGIVFLVRYFDHASLDRLKRMYQQVSRNNLIPKSIAIVREPNEAQFKMSCSHCRENIWMRDRNVGKRGNCPHCRKPFFIPSQKTFITSYLMLTDVVNVHMVSTESHDYERLLATLIEQILSDRGVDVTTTIQAPHRPGLLKRYQTKLLNTFSRNTATT